MTTEVKAPFEFFTDTDGTALASGKIYIGESGLDAETNPISVYWDADLTVPASQPIRTIAGHPDNNGTAAKIYVEGGYSITVRTSTDTLVYSLSVGATDFSFVSPVRTQATAELLASQSDGNVGFLGGLPYEVDSTVSLADSVANDLGVAGLKAFGFAQPGHYGDTSPDVKPGQKWVRLDASTFTYDGTAISTLDTYGGAVVASSTDATKVWVNQAGEILAEDFGFRDDDGTTDNYDRWIAANNVYEACGEIGVQLGTLVFTSPLGGRYEQTKGWPLRSYMVAKGINAELHNNRTTTATDGDVCVFFAGNTGPDDTFGLNSRSRVALTGGVTSGDTSVEIASASSYFSVGQVITLIDSTTYLSGSNTRRTEHFSTLITAISGTTVTLLEPCDFTDSAAEAYRNDEVKTDPLGHEVKWAKDASLKGFRVTQASNDSVRGVMAYGSAYRCEFDIFIEGKRGLIANAQVLCDWKVRGVVDGKVMDVAYATRNTRIDLYLEVTTDHDESLVSMGERAKGLHGSIKIDAPNFTRSDGAGGFAALAGVNISSAVDADLYLDMNIPKSHDLILGDNGSDAPTGCRIRGRSVTDNTGLTGSEIVNYSALIDGNGGVIRDRNVIESWVNRGDPADASLQVSSDAMACDVLGLVADVRYLDISDGTSVKLFRETFGCPDDFPEHNMPETVDLTVKGSNETVNQFVAPRYSVKVGDTITWRTVARYTTGASGTKNFQPRWGFEDASFPTLTLPNSVTDAVMTWEIEISVTGTTTQTVTHRYKAEQGDAWTETNFALTENINSTAGMTFDMQYRLDASDTEIKILSDVLRINRSAHH